MAESVSALLGGVAFDVVHLTVRKVALLMAAVAAVTAALWVIYAWSQWHRGGTDDKSKQLGSAASDDEQEQLFML